MGTVVNIAAVLVGGAIGLLLKHGLKERFQEILLQALGLSVLFVGITGALRGLMTVNGGMLETQNILFMIASIVLGALLGEWWRLDDRLDSIGERLRSLVKAEDENNKFVEGFVSASIIIIVGAMAIVGPIQDALMKDPTMLYAKSALDCVICLVLASSLGIGVLFAALPMGLYQGIITIMAGLIEPYLSAELTFNISFIGSLMICCIGINMLWKTKIRVANFLP
ncbi:MAG TPA: DUF554 domain-containing protein, partial [Clostridiaceae bacterium]|nr:DUF554 domain-containing protein [Clostridiaceae bacterium]